MANKKILFIYAPGMGAQWPNYGLVMLASRMKELGHTPQVIDYNFTPDAPDLKTCLQEFAPDIVGFSLYTASMENTRRLVQVVRVNAPQTPIIGGGPHASVYSEEIEKEQVLDWLFIGNAEESLAHHLSSIKRESQTVVVKDPPPTSRMFPMPTSIWRGVATPGWFTARFNYLEVVPTPAHSAR